MHCIHVRIIIQEIRRLEATIANDLPPPNSNITEDKEDTPRFNKKSFVKGIARVDKDKFVEKFDYGTPMGKLGIEVFKSISLNFSLNLI